tara:strand:- start:181 stop:435 length:255 start_codon:yes stop_codon:yes gene_type:complete
MNEVYKEWYYYLQKEDEATSPSTKALYTRLKELHRDKITAMNFQHLETDEYFALVKYLEKQIKSNEEKLSILMNLEVDLPEFYD